MGGLLHGPAAVLLAGERAGDQPAGVGGPAPQTSALPAHHVLHADPLLGLRAAWSARLQPARLLPEARKTRARHATEITIFLKTTATRN